MTPSAKAALQSRMLDRIKTTSPGSPPTDTEIAAVAGVDRSLVSKWRSGEREIGVSELLNLAAAYGGVVVLQPFADAGDCEVVPRERPTGCSDLRVMAGQTVLGAAEFNVSVQAALADGRVTDEEAADLQRRADLLVSDLYRMRSRAVAS